MADAISRQAFSDLIGSIYDCALDPVWSKTHLTAFSCDLLMIITQQSLAALDAPLSIEVTVPRK
jgi:hypothetical protein